MTNTPLQVFVQTVSTAVSEFCEHVRATREQLARLEEVAKRSEAPHPVQPYAVPQPFVHFFDARSDAERDLQKAGIEAIKRVVAAESVYCNATLLLMAQSGATEEQVLIAQMAGEAIVYQAARALEGTGAITRWKEPVAENFLKRFDLPTSKSKGAGHLAGRLVPDVAPPPCPGMRF